MGLTNGWLTPVYLVIDVSWSMSTRGRLDAANQMIGAVAETLRRDPAVARRIRCAVIDFSQDAQVRLPLCDLAGDDVELPRLQARNGTSFSAAFTAVRRQIDADATRWPGGHRHLGPPMVFFMSDGGPTDDESTWRTAFEALIAHDSSPAVVPCGIDEAEVHVMGSLIHPLTGPARTALFMAHGAAAAAAITGVGEILIASLRRSADDGRPVLPEQPELPAGVLRYEPEQFG